LIKSEVDQMTTVSVEQSYAGWGFWLKWIVAGSIGWTASFILSISAIGAVVQALWGDPDTILAEGTLAFHTALTLLFTLSGLGYGIAQWLVLRRLISGSKWWPLATGIGFMLAAALFGVIALAGVQNIMVNEVIHNVVAGAGAGAAQWLILRRQMYAADWWVLVNIAGFLLAGAVINRMVVAAGGNEAIGGILGVTAMTMLTGAVLVWLLRQPAPEI
jgi:hypothetical protein